MFFSTKEETAEAKKTYNMIANNLRTLAYYYIT